MTAKQEKARTSEKVHTPTTASLRKVQFGAITKQKPDSRTPCPVLPDPQRQFAAIAVRIIERSAQMEALEGALELDKAELKTLATPFYFTHASGKVEVPSSIAVLCTAGTVLVTYQNRYGKLDSEEPLLPILGEHIAVNQQPDATFGLTTDWWNGHVEKEVGPAYGRLLQFTESTRPAGKRVARDCPCCASLNATEPSNSSSSESSHETHTRNPHLAHGRNPNRRHRVQRSGL